ncbi:MAG: hypothetical protein KF901_14565 [Myxococcales bacterium]|nr:hypothetical protein [Myxococcales bacterium]
MNGARITDAVSFYQRKGEGKDAVRLVRQRDPDKFRWRSAVSKLTSSAGRMRGSDRMKIEEPIREVVLDLADDGLQREVVLDARRFNVDLDRGEILPAHTMGDVRRYAFLVGADVRVIERYVELPEDFAAPVDVAACALVGRAMANHHRRRAQKIWLELPDPEDPEPRRHHHDLMADRAARDAELARRWAAFAKTLLGT